ncbi:hypothetical protein AK812_SmicGene43565 [Symbiodinium microadriaticum]|uniref:Uncharacterized protein n=1 Tax=Symbiodinium microadriaticum TaxID=2951 RepID=A0A1Q9C0Q1_SYMMI|nr:hypothetical protein AK812_SmicGene43565 [Symbiodinium microadriaticum]
MSSNKKGERNMDAPAKMKVMDCAAEPGAKQAVSLKIANAIRPAIESRLDQLRDDKERCICYIDGTKTNGDDVSRPDNYELRKVYIVSLTSGVTCAKVAVLYLSCVYGFWSAREIKRRGRKGAIKDAADWAVLQGSNLRKLAAYVITALHRTPYARTEEMMVLKALHQRINRTVVPDRPNRRATSQAAIAIEDLAHDSQSSSSATSSAGSTIDLLDSDDDREVSSEGDCEVAYCDREEMDETELEKMLSEIYEQDDPLEAVTIVSDGDMGIEVDVVNEHDIDEPAVDPEQADDDGQTDEHCLAGCGPCEEDDDSTTAKRKRRDDEAV